MGLSRRNATTEGGSTMPGSGTWSREILTRA